MERRQRIISAAWLHWEHAQKDCAMCHYSRLSYSQFLSLRPKPSLRIFKEDFCNKVVVHFLMSTGADAKFTVDPNTGEVRTGPSSLDREEKSVYRMTAVATDSGKRQVH